jgi:hypothetical protein
VGRRREARFQWSQSLTLSPEPEEVDKIQAKLAQGLPTRNQARVLKRPNQTARKDTPRRKRTDNQVTPSSPQLQ